MKFFDNSWDQEFNYNWYPERITRPRFRRQHSLNSLIRPSMFKADFDLKPYLNKCRHVISNLTSNYYDKEGFQVRLNVKNFEPSEVKVQIVGNTIVVEGKHEEKHDEHDQMYRHFVRKYSLPSGVNANDVISTLSSDGLLTIKARSTAKSIESKERVIPIRQATETVKSLQKENIFESRERIVPIHRAGSDSIRARTKAHEMEFFERIIPIQRTEASSNKSNRGEKIFQDTIKSTRQDKLYEDTTKCSRQEKIYEDTVKPTRQDRIFDDTIRSSRQEKLYEDTIKPTRQEKIFEDTIRSLRNDKVYETRERVIPIRQTDESNITAHHTERTTDYKREVEIPIKHQTTTADDSYNTSSKSNKTETKERIITITQLNDAVRDSSSRSKAAATIGRAISVHDNIGTIVEEPPTPRLQSQEREIPVINQITEINEGPAKPPRTFASHERVVPILQTGESSNRSERK